MTDINLCEPYIESTHLCVKLDSAFFLHHQKRILCSVSELINKQTNKQTSKQTHAQRIYVNCLF